MKVRRAILAVLAVPLILLWTGGCEDQISGPDSDGLADVGTRLHIEFREWAPYIPVTVTGSTVSVVDATMDLRVYSVGPTPVDDPDSTLYIEYYRIDYYSSDPDAVPLEPLIVPLTMRIAPGVTLTIRGLLYFTAENALLWYQQGNPNKEALYEAKITFGGHNEYGYEFTTVYYNYVLLYTVSGA